MDKEKVLEKIKELIEISKDKKNTLEYKEVVAHLADEDITDDQILGVMTRIVRGGKSIYMDDPSYMAYVHLWCDAYPARMGILKAGRGAKALLRKATKLLG